MFLLIQTSNFKASTLRDGYSDNRHNTIEPIDLNGSLESVLSFDGMLGEGFSRYEWPIWSMGDLFHSVKLSGADNKESLEFPALEFNLKVQRSFYRF